MTSSATRRIFSEGAWIAAGQIASAAGTLVGVRLLTEILPPRVFGEVVLALGIGTLALGLSAGPLMQAVLRLYSESVATNSVAILRAVATRWVRRFAFVVGGIFLVAYFWFSQMVTISPYLGVILATLLGLDVVRQLEVVLFNAARRQEPTAIWIAAEAWGRPALAWVAVLLTGATAVATLSGYVVASLLLFVGFALLSEREGIQKAVNEKRTEPVPSVRRPNPSNPAEQFDQKERLLSDQLISYALPLLPLGLIGWISGQADRYMIGGMIGIEQAGLYAALYGIVSRPFLMASAILELWMRPIYYQAVSSHDPVLEKKILTVWIFAAVCASLGGFAVFFLWNNEIVSAILAPPYRGNAALMPWIAAGYGFLIIAQVFARICYAHKNTKAVLAIEAIGSAAALIVTIAALKHFGMAGAAYAVPMYFSLQLVAAMLLALLTYRRRQASPILTHRSSIA